MTFFIRFFCQIYHQQRELKKDVAEWVMAAFHIKLKNYIFLVPEVLQTVKWEAILIKWLKLNRMVVYYCLANPLRSYVRNSSINVFTLEAMWGIDGALDIRIAIVWDCATQRLLNWQKINVEF